jgi:aspartyl-tRNA synthetase
MRADAYDLVLNGVGNRRRLYPYPRPRPASRNFKLLGFTPEEAEAQFGFLLGAFEYGAPPARRHRFRFRPPLRRDERPKSIRDFIAFPKNNQGRDMMIDAPSPIAPAQLDELYLALKKV